MLKFFPRGSCNNVYLSSQSPSDKLRQESTKVHSAGTNESVGLPHRAWVRVIYTVVGPPPKATPDSLHRWDYPPVICRLVHSSPSLRSFASKAELQTGSGKLLDGQVRVM